MALCLIRRLALMVGVACLAAGVRPGSAAGAQLDPVQVVRGSLLHKDEMPGFQHSWDGDPFGADKAKWVMVSQVFQRRTGAAGEGKDPTMIRVEVHLTADRVLAAKDARMSRRTQTTGGLPPGSLTGAAFGEASWASSPKARNGVATLVVLDGRCVVKAIINYAGVAWPSQHSAHTTHVQDVSSDDARLAENAVRIVLRRLAAAGMTVKTKP